MYKSVNPKLPMRNKEITKAYYTEKLGFKELGSADFPAYLMLEKDDVELHFFEFKELNPDENYGQIYIRCQNIVGIYKLLMERKTTIHPNGALQLKPWGQLEFSLLDPDKNLLTFGEKVEL